MILVAILFPGPVVAQSCTDGPPTSLGLVVELLDPCPSGAGPLPNTTCRWLEVHCDGLDSLRVQLRITEPDPEVPLRGTVVFGTGGSGTGFYGNSPAGESLFTRLAGLGYRVVDRAWAGPNGWTTAEAGLRRMACRYATLLTWIHGTLHTGGDFCASGNSGGSAEIGYALTTWGRGDILDVAVPTSGPAVARLDYSCLVPTPAAWDSLCQAIVPAGALICPRGWDCAIPDNGVCFQCSVTPTAQDLWDDSVVHPAALLGYPNTRCHFLYGSLDCGISVPIGLTWSTGVTSQKTIEFVANTGHGMSSTLEGRDAIVRAILGGNTTGVPPTAPPQGRLTLSLATNPMRGRSTLSIGGLEAKRTDVAIFDVAGRRVRTLFEGVPAGPTVTLTVDPGGLPRGVSFIVAQHGGVRTATPLVVLGDGN